MEGKESMETTSVATELNIEYLLYPRRPPRLLRFSFAFGFTSSAPQTPQSHKPALR
jgi:hypothetical protein